MHRAQVRAELLGQGPHSTVRPTRLEGGPRHPSAPSQAWAARVSPSAPAPGGPAPSPPCAAYRRVRPPGPTACVGTKQASWAVAGGSQNKRGRRGFSGPPRVGAHARPHRPWFGGRELPLLFGSGRGGTAARSGPPTRRTSAQGAWEQWGPFPRQEDSGVQGKGVLQVRTLCLQGGGRSDGEGREGRGGQKLWPIAPHGAGQA